MGSLGKGLFLVVCVILILQAAASRALSIVEQDVPGPELRKMPMQLDGRTALGELNLDPTVAEALKPDDYILRDYGDGAGGASVNVFVAYFKSLQYNYGPHSPRICLPGSGWLTRSASVASLEIPGRAESIPINEFMMERASERIVVVYWYQNDRDVWAEEYRAKLKLLPNLLRYRRSDVSLVRLVMPVHGEGWNDRLATCLKFAQRLFPVVNERFAAADKLLSEGHSSDVPPSSY
jgi:EpsI family protein